LLSIDSKSAGLPESVGESMGRSRWTKESLCHPGQSPEWTLARVTKRAAVARAPAGDGCGWEEGEIGYWFPDPVSGAKVWKIEQIFVDEAELNDWSARFEVDLSASAEEGRAVISLIGIGPIVEE